LLAAVVDVAVGDCSELFIFVVLLASPLASSSVEELQRRCWVVAERRLLTFLVGQEEDKKEGHHWA
jgi:hypothetical protein